MNIFYLSHNVEECARHMIDKHIVKMPLESMQLLSTAVRLTVGVSKPFVDDTGTTHYVNVLEGERVLFADVCVAHYADGSTKRITLRHDSKLPKHVIALDFIKQKPYYDPETQRALAISHVNHPSNVWVRQSIQNFNWLKDLTLAMECEWKLRYAHPEHVRHKSVQLLDVMPQPILNDSGFTQPTPAMPDKYKVEGDSIASYWNYYRAEKLLLQ